MCNYNTRSDLLSIQIDKYEKREDDIKSRLKVKCQANTCRQLEGKTVQFNSKAFIQSQIIEYTGQSFKIRDWRDSFKFEILAGSQILCHDQGFGYF